MPGLISKSLSSPPNWAALRLALFPESAETSVSKLSASISTAVIEKAPEKALAGSRKREREEKRAMLQRFGHRVGVAEADTNEKRLVNQRSEGLLKNRQVSIGLTQTREGTAEKTPKSPLRLTRFLLVGSAIVSFSALTAVAHNYSEKTLLPDRVGTSMARTFGRVKSASQLKTAHERRKSFKMALVGTSFLGVCVGTTLWVLKIQ